MPENASESARLLALGRDRYLPIYRPRQLILERGLGSRLWDSEGREYVDLAGGIAVCGRRPGRRIAHRRRRHRA